MSCYTLLPPAYTLRSDGRRFELGSPRDGLYADERFDAVLTVERVSDECVRVGQRWTNRSGVELEFQPELRVKAGFAYDRYLIPGVSVNGNAWGKGKEPKGFERDGQPWVFDYRRTTLPSCTISENAERFMALMASDGDAASLVSSCSMSPDTDGHMIHRILYPSIERPLTYCRRDEYSGPYETWIGLAPGEAFCATAYIIYGRPTAVNFAAANVQDVALKLLGKEYPPKYSMAELRGLCVNHAKRLLWPVNGRQMFAIGMSPKDGAFEKRYGFEFGWCGQNGMYARLFIQRGLSIGDGELVNIGISNLDAWSNEAVCRSGLICTQYDLIMDGKPRIVDTCNQGFAVRELARAYTLLRDAGISKPEYLRAAMGVADFFVEHYSPENGFGKAWNAETGECVDWGGTIGAYMVPGLVELFAITQDEGYIDCAKRAYRLYRARDLDEFACTAGALDTCCIDKETSGPMLTGALMLYGTDGDPEWLEGAQRAAWYFCSWMMHYDTVNAPESDFAREGYHTLGGTCVSAQHHHIDPWGALMVPELLKLWKITDDERWKKRARLMWANAIQNIAPMGGNVIHGLTRHAGAQNEGYHHCRWGDANAPGYMNDWLVAWPQAYCLNVAMEFEDNALA